MPVAGVRVPVKLPWLGATDNSPQFVSMKKPVADFFKFNVASKNDLTYSVKVNKKDKSSTEKVSGTTTIKRRRRPGYKQRSVIVVFQTGHKSSAGRKSTLTGKTVKINNQEYKSLQFPITTSVAIDDVVSYFETGAGKGLNALRVIDANSGQGYPVINTK